MVMMSSKMWVPAVAITTNPIPCWSIPLPSPCPKKLLHHLVGALTTRQQFVLLHPAWGPALTGAWWHASDTWRLCTYGTGSDWIRLWGTISIVSKPIHIPCLFPVEQIWGSQDQFVWSDWAKVLLDSIFVAKAAIWGSATFAQEKKIALPKATKSLASKLEAFPLPWQSTGPERRGMPVGLAYRCGLVDTWELWQFCKLKSIILSSCFHFDSIYNKLQCVLNFLILVVVVFISIAACHGHPILGDEKWDINVFVKEINCTFLLPLGREPK